MSRVGYYVKFTARAGQRDALVERLLRAAELAGSAPGCELYIVNTALAEADVVWVTEVWRSAEDHRASLEGLATEEGRAMLAETLALLAGPPERTDVLPVGGKGLAGEQA
jgi:quinol monooxygenase YgiN